MEMIDTTYHLGLVALSFGVAIFASFVALDLVGSLAQAAGRMKILWLIAGALAMGCGIWSMHFIGMLAFEMPGMMMSYDTTLMLISIGVAVVASGFALSIMSRPSVSRTALTASAFAMAAAIAGMHYLGMYSMRMSAVIVWDPFLVALSLLIALGASFVAIIIAIRLPHAESPLQMQTMASLVMGVAIAGMHYSGMQAAMFHHAEVLVNQRGSVLATSELTSVVIVTTILILALALAGSFIDRMLTRRSIREREHARKAQEAELSSSLKTRFLANMSHEIRTPLGAIIGFTELLIEDNLNEKQRDDHLRTVLRSARALSQLLDDILDLSKIEMDKLEIEKREFELRPFLDEILMMLKVKADEKGLGLSFSTDMNLPERIISDSVRLRQILVNLVGNSIKFTANGTVRLRLTSRDNGALLGFEIEDTGIGLTEEQAERLFQPFTQADNSTTRVFGGTGLGLDISRRLAAALGGNVEILRSLPGQGTTFLATIKLESNEMKVSASAPVAAAVAPISLNGLNVLVVDDNQDNRVLITRILEKRGAAVTTANNGKIGVDSAQATPFDVILMDIQMPVMNGYEAMQRLRELGNPTPIVALTAHAFREEREACFANGCDAYLTKPIQVGDLVSTLSVYSRL